MGYLKYVRELWKQPKANMGDVYKEKLISYRKQPVTVRLERPTRVDRARSIGYRAKQGFVVVRQMALRGGRQRPDIKHGRRSQHSGQRKNVAKNYQQICEERACKKFPNCEVLGSYWVGDDGMRIWYEVILIDRQHPQIQADRQLKRIAAKRGRAERGLTSAGRKSRGLRNKGKGAEKIRPSLRANKRLH
ncbi:50S ribosomal protein L15e [Candidatus Woesearchaeota archaeon]|nr:50S ribosomal protein L15e [Candidatus Woesearchaeota archaeon]